MDLDLKSQAKVEMPLKSIISMNQEVTRGWGKKKETKLWVRLPVP